jgi:hypothetical protein
MQEYTHHNHRPRLPLLICDLELHLHLFTDILLKVMPESVYVKRRDSVGCICMHPHKEPARVRVAVLCAVAASR